MWTGHEGKKPCQNPCNRFFVKEKPYAPGISLVGRCSVIAAPYDTDSVQTVVLSPVTNLCTRMHGGALKKLLRVTAALVGASGEISTLLSVRHLTLTQPDPTRTLHHCHHCWLERGTQIAFISGRQCLGTSRVTKSSCEVARLWLAAAAEHCQWPSCCRPVYCSCASSSSHAEPASTPPQPSRLLVAWTALH